MGLEVKSSKPPKRLKTANHHNTMFLLSSTSSDQDKSIYKRKKVTMKNMKPPERSSKTAQFLMRETLLLRQKWIQEDLPVVKEILTEFTLLENYTTVSVHVYVDMPYFSSALNAILYLCILQSMHVVIHVILHLLATGMGGILFNISQSQLWYVNMYSCYILYKSDWFYT